MNSTYENILRLLRVYKVNKVKVKLYEIEVEGISEVLASGALSAIEDEADCIEGMSLQAHKLDDSPKYQNNLFWSSTERAALDYVREMFWSEDRNKLKEKIKDIKSRINILNIEIKQVDAMLEVLNREQKFVVEQFYIEGYRWPEIVEQYTLTYNLAYSLQTFYAWRDKALSLMESILFKTA